jgi:hypothetical protein
MAGLDYLRPSDLKPVRYWLQTEPGTLLIANVSGNAGLYMRTQIRQAGDNLEALVGLSDGIAGRIVLAKYGNGPALDVSGVYSFLLDPSPSEYVAHPTPEPGAVYQDLASGALVMWTAGSRDIVGWLILLDKDGAAGAWTERLNTERLIGVGSIHVTRLPD